MKNDDMNLECTHERKNKKIEKNDINTEELYVLAEFFKALGDQSRLLIIQLLAKKPMCVCDIAESLSMTQPLVSHHLKLMRSLGLVKYKKEGRMYIYSLDDEHVFQIYKQGLEHAREKI